MARSLSALRLRAALHLLSLEGADISKIVRAHAQSLGLEEDVCQPLTKEISTALDAVVALAAHSNELANPVTNPTATTALSLCEGIADWFSDSAGADFDDFAFPALHHRDNGGQMTFQFAEALSSAINNKGGLAASDEGFRIDSILAEASTDPRFATFVAEATTHNISYHADGNAHNLTYIASAPLQLSTSPAPSPLDSSAKRPTSSHAKVPPRKRTVADVNWGDSDADALSLEKADQPTQVSSASHDSQAAAAADQPAKTLASIVDIDAFLARVHKRT